MMKKKKLKSLASRSDIRMNVANVLSQLRVYHMYLVLFKTVDLIFQRL